MASKKKPGVHRKKAVAKAATKQTVVKTRAKVSAKTSSQRAVKTEAQASAESPAPVQSRWRRFGLFAGLPLAIYFVFFCLFTWPWMAHFNGMFFTDGGDGMQNVWNIWWIDKAVTQLHHLPWYTSYLHAPEGVSLLAQTLNPFNGFVGVVLLGFLSLTQVFNAMIVFSFIMSGLTAFWLCYYFTKRYWPSVIGGFVFTFSSYHFAHAIGHMQLVSLEWVPLFILFWWMLLKKPSYLLAVGTAVSLLLVLFCDYYYFIYCVVTAVASLIYLWRKGEFADIRQKTTYRPFILFSVLALLLVAPLPLKLLILNAKDTLVGSHDARVFSTGLLSPFIDGGFWRFHSLTQSYWGHVHAFVAESTVYLGYSVLAVIGYAVVKRKKVHSDINFWLILGAVFAIFSLGPRLLLRGDTVEHAPLPYAILERIFPQIKLSGVPVRMMVMTTLAAAIIAAMVLAKLNLKNRRHQLVLVAFVMILTLEMFPSTLPLTSPVQPKYVGVLRKLPATGSVLDNAADSQTTQLFHQIGFDKPMILGYISRTPQSVMDKDAVLVGDIGAQHYDKLCSVYKLRYFTTPASRPLATTFPIVYRDNVALIYDLKNSPNC